MIRVKIPAGGKPTIKLEGLLTLEQTLLIKALSRLAKLEKKLDAQTAQLSAMEKKADAAAKYAHTRLYTNCIGIQQTYIQEGPGPRDRPLSPRVLRLTLRLRSGQALTRLGPDQAALVAEDDRLHAVAEPELPEDVPDVGLDGRLLDHERRSDLTVREPARDQLEDVALARW